jgi:hypothetical protein
VHQRRSRRASLNERTPASIDATAVTTLAAEPLASRYKRLPSSWWGWTPAQQRLGPDSTIAENLTMIACRVVDLVRTFF